MGKKSKIFKSGLPRNQIKKTKPINIKKEIAKLPINTISNENSKQPTENNIKDNNQIKQLPYINYNLDALKKANDSLGLTEDQIKLLYSHPLRNRRFVHNLTLTRREKKKRIKKNEKINERKNGRKNKIRYNYESKFTPEK